MFIKVTRMWAKYENRYSVGEKMTGVNQEPVLVCGAFNAYPASLDYIPDVRAQITPALGGSFYIKESLEEIEEQLKQCLTPRTAVSEKLI